MLTQPTEVRSSTEFELLFCCARTHLDATTAERVGCLLREDLNWQELIRAAFRHGVIPLVYRNLNTVCPEAVPKPVLTDLQRSFHANALNNRFLAEELLKLLKCFEAHDIRAVPYKGAVLAASAYGDLSLRRFGDLDILIQAHDFSQVKRLLCAAGYQPRQHMSLAQETTYLKSKRALGFLRQDGRVAVDIQWGITLYQYYTFPVEGESFWERLEPFSLNGAKVPNIPAEEMLQILCIHGSRHHWELLKWICDVAELIRTHQHMDWEKVMGQASALGNARMLFLGLLLAHDLLGTSLPQHVMQKVQVDPVVKSLAATAREQLTRPLKKWEKFAFYLVMRERWQDRVRYLADKTMTPDAEDRALVQLPAGLFVLYYLIRPFRLIGRLLQDLRTHQARV